MLVTIKANKDIYDNTKKELEFERTEELKEIKFFVKSIDEVKAKIEAYIEKTFDCDFNSSLAEASPDLHSSLIYYCTIGEKHYQLMLRVESDNKKIVFRDYYPFVAHNMPLNDLELSA